MSAALIALFIVVAAYALARAWKQVRAARRRRANDARMAALVERVKRDGVFGDLDDLRKRALKLESRGRDAR